MGHGKKIVRERGQCRARYFVRDYEREPCRWFTKPGEPWCWVHQRTLDAKLATEEELQSGTRSAES